MADLVVPGVWWLHHTRGSNVYMVEADDGQLAIVDSGFGSNVEAILSEVASVTNGRPLSFILLTHSHFDHVGAALELRRITGARVAAGKGDCSTAGGEAKYAIGPATGRSHVARLVSRWIVHRRVAAVPVDAALEGETVVLPGIRAMPVPGHTPGSYCYVAEKAGAAFVGDLVISHRGRLSRPAAYSNRDEQAHERSLAAFAAIAPEAGCPGHGQPLAVGFAEALQGLASSMRPRPSIRRTHQRMVKMQSFTRNMYRRRKPKRP